MYYEIMELRAQGFTWYDIDAILDLPGQDRTGPSGSWRIVQDELTAQRQLKRELQVS